MLNNLCFEQGPIRPPNEARSLLLRVTRNCPWNQCMFCPVYKGQKFSLRTVEEIKSDILNIKEISDNIKNISKKLGYNREINSSVLNHVFNHPEYTSNYRSIAMWLYYNTKACFLQDADNLIMKNKDLIFTLEFLRENLPEIKRVTTYSRSRTVVRKSLEALLEIKRAGLDRIHIGLESGNDQVLKKMKKGVTGEQHVLAGEKVIKAGIELSEYVMPGLGGKEMWEEHAIDTAKVLNQVNPHFIRLRSLRIPDNVPLAKELKQGQFTLPTDDMVVEEIKLFLENLEGITSTVTSDHMMNLLEEVSGKLPENKDRMIEVILKYQGLSEKERALFRIGRRGGAYRSTDDLASDPVTRSKIERMFEEIKAESGDEGVENFIRDMMSQSL